MKRAAPIAAFAVAIVSCTKEQPPAPAEIQPITRMQLDSSTTVEVIGLRRWTVQMIEDSLAKYAPGDGLPSPTTPTNLRQRLHFADAAMATFSQVFDEDETTRIIISVREPQDSARVHYAPQHLDSLARLEEWKGIASALAGHENLERLNDVAGAHLEGPSHLVQDSTVDRKRYTHRVGFVFDAPEDSMAARPILDSLARRTTDHDLALALRTIDSSSSAPDRVVAVLVLANFPKRDEAWRALFQAAVGQAQLADAEIAQRALLGLSARFPRSIDWSPVAAPIHDMLDGMGLSAISAVATTLLATGASPANAKAWLAGGGEMLTADLESTSAEIRDPAHKLLVALRGEDLGLEPAPWRAWIRTL